jgi:hypothetical protein
MNKITQCHMTDGTSLLLSVSQNQAKKLDKVPTFCPEAISKFD